MSHPATAPRLLNRELGTLEFNRRVLFQALDDTNPLLERLRFLSIVSSNMDEFFETRVATLQDMLEADPASGIVQIMIDGQTSVEFTHGDIAQVAMSEKKIRLVSYPNRSYYALLREKLKWGDALF